MSDLELGTRMFLQLAVILATCRAVGWFGKRFLGQTQVVSEIIAGVLLGPSVFKLIAPSAQAWVFPTSIVMHGETVRHPSMQILYAMSQIGLAMYMFVVGIDFDGQLLLRQKGAVGLVSGCGIVVPFACGALIAWGVFGDPRYFPPGIDLTSATLFTGAAMCITAFPVLARIVSEKGLAKTALGNLVLGAGAFGDAVAWIILAIVLAITKHDPMKSALALGGGVAYVLFMVTAGRWVFARIGDQADRDGKVSDSAFALCLAIVMLASWTTDAIGIYAVFGAFIAGSVMPKGLLAEIIKSRIESITVTLLLPLYFVFSGLNTHIGLINSTSLWLMTALIIFAAMAGKAVACALAAKACGRSWRESIAIGTLMNTRGLMELIILNIGRESGLITDTLFTMLVLMAAVTTFITSPLFEWIYRPEANDRALAPS